LISFFPNFLNFFSILGTISAMVLSIGILTIFYQDWKYRISQISETSEHLVTKSYDIYIYKTIDLVSSFGITVSLFTLHTASPQIFRSMIKPMI
jgi:hypothetical protein